MPLESEPTPSTRPLEAPAVSSEVMARVMAGDAEAVRTLYELHAPLVYGLALRMLQDRAGAEDVTQEVFLQLWLRADRFDPSRGSVRAWIWAIARSRALDYLRWRAARRGGAERRVEPAAPTAVAPEERADIVAALGSLSDQHRRVVELSYYHGMSHSEIAALLDEPLGTVKTRIRYALQGLRVALTR